MEELKEIILCFFKENKKYYTKEQLRKKLNIKGEVQTNIFNEALNMLIENGSLFFDTKKGYRFFTNYIGIAFGEI